MKVDLDLVKVTLQRNGLDVRQVAAILEEINQEAAAAIDDSREPPIKKQFVVLLGKGNQTAHIVQIAEEDSASIAVDYLHAAAREFNVSPRGRRLPVKTIAEACEYIPTRYLKEKGLWVRTKEPVYALMTPAKL